MRAPRLTIITDLKTVSEHLLVARIRSASRIKAEERTLMAVQLRDPELSGRALLDLGVRLRDATRALGISLIVNDRLDLALALGADGVHLGRRSVSIADARSLLGSSVWISASCHAVSEVTAAHKEGADAALLSPIFASPGKGSPLGTYALRSARESIKARGGRPIHLIALGGVDATNAVSCFTAGADGVAAIRADLIDSGAVRLSP